MKPTNPTRKLASLTTLVLAGLALSSPALASNYTITDLGTLGHTNSYAYDINNSSQVVGYAYNADYADIHIFLYSNGAMTDLGGGGSANRINDSGQVVGNYVHAFLYSNGVMTDFSNLAGITGSANGINNSGQVVGSALWSGSGYNGSGGFAWHAFLYSNGAMTNLGTLGGGNSGAADINDNGQVVGSSSTAGNVATHAFLYSNGAMADLGTLGGTNSNASRINDNGQVVGDANTAGNAATHAFIYSNGSMTDLGTLGGTASHAYGLNDNGQVVGESNGHAFLYSGNDLFDLNNLLPSDSEWTLSEAQGINDLGQIVGQGTINGEQHAFLMTPTAVPAPSSAWLLGSGLMGLIGVARRRR